MQAFQEYDEAVITEDNFNNEVESIYLKGETKVFSGKVEIFHSNETSLTSKVDEVSANVNPISLEELHINNELSNSFRTKLQNFRMTYDNQIDILIVILVLALAFF